MVGENEGDFRIRRERKRIDEGVGMEKGKREEGGS